MAEEILIEACVNSVESAIEAQKGGARRVELCDNLYEGGTTPSAGVVRCARQHLDIDLNVIIRARGGDFLYSDIEFEIMKYDVSIVKRLGADGIVIGILNTDGTIDIDRTQELVDLAWPMNVTFHRAFDMTADPFQAMETLIKLGIDRILTSGQRPSALAGIELISQLVQNAKDRIIIMPGVDIDETNIRELITKTGATEYHVLAQKRIESPMIFRNHKVFMGSNPDLPEYETFLTDSERISAICREAVP